MRFTFDRFHKKATGRSTKQASQTGHASAQTRLEIFEPYNQGSEGEFMGTGTEPTGSAAARPDPIEDLPNNNSKRDTSRQTSLPDHA